MSTAAITLVSDASKVRAALAPLRRRILEHLREPGSAVSVAADLGLSRQKLAYHFRMLEDAGLIRLVEERPRRGCTERIFIASSDAFVIDPTMMNAPDPAASDRAAPDRAIIDTQDRFASDHMVRTAAALVADVARMREAADDQGKRLLTLTIDAELAFADPAEFDRFGEELTHMIAELAKKYSTAKKKCRRYRLLAAAHPAVKSPSTPALH